MPWTEGSTVEPEFDHPHSGSHFAAPETAYWRRPSIEEDLTDADYDGHWVNLAFGVINLAILVALVVVGIALLIMALAPSGMTSALTNEKGALPVGSRFIFLLGSAVSLVTVRLLGRRLEDIWRWARLQTSGSLTIDELGITITHDAVLTTGVFLPWDSIKAVSFDTGKNHDTATHWRRFPLLPVVHKREFLFATDGHAVAESALIASRPTPPNMVIVLTEPVPLHNPHVGAIDAVFPREATDGMPSRPPKEQSEARILFLRAAEPARVHRTVSISGKVRPLRKSDLPGLFLNRVT
jgi:hypothetical protein